MGIIKNLGHIFFHVAIIVVSAAAALSLPSLVRAAAENVLVYWAFIENGKIFLVSLELAVAVTLIILLNYLGRSWKDRKRSGMAKSAGLFFVSSARNIVGRTRLKRMKRKQGPGRNVMVIGSTGFRTFVEPEGDLHHVVQHCREAKIMLLDPRGEGASARARSIQDPQITQEGFREQILKSIEFLKGLKGLQKNIKLKLYRDTPLLKLAILGDYAYVRHYHTGLDVQQMPEYVFRHDPKPGGLYSPLYQYFVERWQDPGIPEYELDTGELVYRDKSGNEIRRELFAEGAVEA